MRFTKSFWSGIADGTVTVAYRWWKRPTVVEGRTYRTGGGRVRVHSVEQIDPTDIPAEDASSAGYRDLDELHSFLDGVYRDRSLFRVGFELVDEPDPREVLAATDNLQAADVADISSRLDRLDKASNHGPWTRRTLRLIEGNPAIRAPDLAELDGRDTKPFKLDVRKLKNLGLTESLRVGYRLSPRGRAFLDAVDE